jgi:dinuclear metal center YbgI/SA1388 family protein
MACTVSDVTAALNAAYPPELAEPWDAVGLVCGDRAEVVERVLVCVDPVHATVEEAVEVGAQLIVAHHPLLLRGVHGVGTDTAKGRLVHRMIRSGIALFCAHTNADSARTGVSDALARVLGLTGLRPLAPHAEGDGATGIGRIGLLPESETLAAFVRRVGAALPDTVPGVSGAGSPDRPITTVAVSGGSGDSYLGAAAAAGVDAYVTADLRHHPAGEHLEAGGPALVGVTHWASEWPWCGQAAEVIRNAGNVEVHVSTRCTDPWNLRA